MDNNILEPVTLGKSRTCEAILLKGTRAGLACGYTAKACDGQYFCKRHAQMSGIDPDPVFLKPLQQPEPQPPNEEDPILGFNPNDYMPEGLYSETDDYQVNDSDYNDAPPPSPRQHHELRPGTKIGSFLQTVANKPKVHETVKVLKEKAKVHKDIAAVKKVAAEAGSQELHEQAEDLEYEIEEQQEQDYGIPEEPYEPKVQEKSPEELRKELEQQQTEQLFVDAAHGTAVITEILLTHNLKDRGVRADGAASRWITDVSVQQDLRTVIREDEYVSAFVQTATPLHRLVARTVGIFSFTMGSNYLTDNNMIPKAPQVPDAVKIDELRRQMPDLPDKP